jgi:anti-anti-sigma factor
MKTNPFSRAIMRASSEQAFRTRLLADPRAALAEEGLEVPVGVKVVVHEPADDCIVLVLPDPSLEYRLAEHSDLPAGPVADAPASLRLDWQGCTLVAAGRIDVDSASILRRELGRAQIGVDLDLADVTFIGSAGLASLLAVQKQLLERGCELRLVRVPQAIGNVLDLAGYAEMFEIVREESLAYLAAACRL